MRKQLLLLILFSAALFTSQKSEAQLYKHWGHWITDTTLDAPNQYTRVYGMVCDTADNVYVQYHDPETGFDTISIKCIGRNGNVASGEYILTIQKGNLVLPVTIMIE